MIILVICYLTFFFCDCTVTNYDISVSDHCTAITLCNVIYFRCCHTLFILSEFDNVALDSFVTCDALVFSFIATDIDPVFVIKSLNIDCGSDISICQLLDIVGILRCLMTHSYAKINFFPLADLCITDRIDLHAIDSFVFRYREKCCIIICIKIGILSLGLAVAAKSVVWDTVNRERLVLTVSH